MVGHEDLFSHFAKFLNFPFDFGIFRDEGFINIVKFSLNGNLEVLENVFDFSSKDRKVIFDFAFLPFDLLFKLVNILFFILQQKH